MLRGIKVTTNCLFCGNPTTDYASQAARRYCSRKCKHAAKRIAITVQCFTCGKNIQATPSRIKWSRERGGGRLYCNADCRVKGNTGPYHVMWISDRSKLSDRRHSERQSARYLAWRKAVLQRDDYTCQECGKRGGYLHAHHVKEWEYYPHLRYNLANGITLCKEPCHRARHAKRKRQAA
jgi:endogenous inhibitor of DNA gyrase (YacG/DUF329 family)